MYTNIDHESALLKIDNAINFPKANVDHKALILEDISVNPENVKKYGRSFMYLIENCNDEKNLFLLFDLMEYLLINNESMAEYFGNEKYQKFIIKFFENSELVLVKKRIFDWIKLCSSVYKGRTDLYYDKTYNLLKHGDVSTNKSHSSIFQIEDTKKPSKNRKSRSFNFDCIFKLKKRYSLAYHEANIRKNILEAKSNSKQLIDLLDNSHGGKYLKCDIDIQITVSLCKKSLKCINKIIEEGSCIYNPYLLNSVLKCCDLLNNALKEYRLLLKGKRVHKIQRNPENEYFYRKKFKNKDGSQIFF